MLVDGEERVDGGELERAIVLAQEGGEQRQRLAEYALQVDAYGRVRYGVERLGRGQTRDLVEQALDQYGPARLQLAGEQIAQIADDLRSFLFVCTHHLVTYNKKNECARETRDIRANDGALLDLLVDVGLPEADKSGRVELANVSAAVDAAVIVRTAQYLGQLLADEERVRRYLVEAVLHALDHRLDEHVEERMKELRLVRHEERVEERERVDLHVGRGRLVVEREEHARHDLSEMAGERARQHAHELHEQREARLTRLAVLALEQLLQRLDYGADLSAQLGDEQLFAACRRRRRRRLWCRGCRRLAVDSRCRSDQVHLRSDRVRLLGEQRSGLMQHGDVDVEYVALDRLLALLEAADEHWRDLVVEAGEQLVTRADDGVQALGRRSPYLPAHVVVVRVVVLIASITCS